jgi:hypothetical protein
VISLKVVSIRLRHSAMTFSRLGGDVAVPRGDHVSRNNDRPPVISRIAAEHAVR